MFSLLAKGTCRISRLSPAQDCQSTIACLTSLGVEIELVGPGEYTVTSAGLDRLVAPTVPLDAGNSGTTIRLLSGLLAGANLSATLDGDASLRKRPMARVLKPLAEMGLHVEYLEKDGCPPFRIQGGHLQGRHFDLPMASAQVQTALLLAGLQSSGETSVTLPHVARDHTERMLRYIGVPFERIDELTTKVERLKTPVRPFEITVAGDISSAAFFMVAAACLPGSNVVLTDVGMNSGRTLVIDVLREMGASVIVDRQQEVCGEPVARISVRGTASLRGVTIAGPRVAAGIDELPILALAGPFCKGTLSVRDAHELRVKESDRIAAIAQNLQPAGAQIRQCEDGFDIVGSGGLAGGSPWNSGGDHRLAMTGMVAKILCQKPVTIDDTACAAVSYPGFDKDLSSLIVGQR
jgi:3-phosphoshikimate 1-carboxyvinyltransferase